MVSQADSKWFKTTTSVSVAHVSDPSYHERRKQARLLNPPPSPQIPYLCLSSLIFSSCYPPIRSRAKYWHPPIYPPRKKKHHVCTTHLLLVQASERAHLLQELVTKSDTAPQVWANEGQKQAKFPKKYRQIMSKQANFLNRHRQRRWKRTKIPNKYGKMRSNRLDFPIRKGKWCQNRLNSPKSTARTWC